MTVKEQQKSFNNRIFAFEIFLLIFIALIILRLFIVSVGQHSYYKALAENQHSFFQKLVPKRGEIFISDKYSSQPYIVATNVQKNMVYAVPHEINDPGSVAMRLGQILNLDPVALEQKISDQNKWYVPIMHELSGDQSNQISAAKLPGTYLSPEDIRYYPEGQFLSQVIGFLGYKDNGSEKIGLYGLERYFQKELAGQPGTISTQSDAKGNWITGGNRYFTPAADGSNLLLTIDRSVQYKAESALSADVQKHGADSGVAIVANPKTGAILAMANYPSFDPNQYGKVTDPSVYLNLATTETYEPGSTMKGITMAGALDLGLVTPDSTYTDTGVVNIGGYKIENSDHKAHGLQTMTQVIDWSLNTGAIYVENLMGNNNFLNYLKKFGFGKPTNIDLYESVGNLSNLNNQNSQINYDTASFGQGITVTPIQMLQAYMAIANGGKMMQPYIIDSKILPDGTVIKTQPKEVGQVISPQAATMDTQMLLDDVNNGYGKKASVKGYDIAGKTGTAQVAANGVYVQNDNIGSFVGFGPVEDPKFIMLVVINHPRDASFAETTATPLFSDIAQFILDYYNVPPNR